MAEYVLCRDSGSEGHSAPLLALDESGVRVALQVLEHSYDGGLAIYKIETASHYGREWRPAGPSKKITIADLVGEDTA